MEYPCPGCGNIFAVRPNRVAKAQRGGPYCSKECRHKSTFGTIICPTCGGAFQGYFAAQKYCSKKCRPPWNKGKPWPAEVKAKMKAAVPDRRGEKNPHWDASVASRKCKTCKRLFRPRAIKRAKAGYGIYCSKTCYQKAKGETVPERLVREALNTLGELYQPQSVMGFFTVDFLLPFRSMVIEVDGAWWHDNPSARRRDKAKTTYLSNRGYRVIRLHESIVRTNAVEAVRTALG